jgi:RNA-directed DNA polymerase
VRRLYSLASTPIKRHEKVSGEYNPYDPAMEIMGETLRMERMLNEPKYQLQTRLLMIRQQGCCALCRYPITKETKCHDHHIIYRTNGGGNSLENRVLLHPTCHTQLHARGLRVSKPEPIRSSTRKTPREAERNEHES